MVGEILVGNHATAELFCAQHKTLDLRPYTPEDEDPIGCRICGRLFNDSLEPDSDLLEYDRCDGDCLDGTGTKAYIIVKREE